MDSALADAAAVEGVRWDLEPIVEGQGSAGVDRLLDEAASHALRLQARRGSIAAMDAPSLEAFMREIEVVHENLARAANYAQLRFAEDSGEESRGALVAKVEERMAAIVKDLVFFDLEWAALSEEAVESLVGDERLAFCRHHLRLLRRFRPYLLTEPEEKILVEKSVTGVAAWTRFYNEQRASSLVDDVPGEDVAVPFELAISKLYNPDRAVRVSAQEAITKSLAPSLRTAAFVYNTLLADKAADDRLRSFPNWASSRHLGNQASQESVDALIAAVVSRYELARRWYRLKARILGLDQLADYDRLVSVAPADTQRSFAWPEAKTVVLDAYRAFSPDMAATAERFFDGPYIDASVRPGKHSGAFCADVSPSQHPYVLVNFDGQRDDVLVLAHELGHGVHFSLSRGQSVFHQMTPLTFAETASVFGETLVFNALLAGESDPKQRLALLGERVDGALQTVFRQVAMFRFEDLCHRHRREQGELSVADINEHWAHTQQELFADAVQVTDNYRTWWSYVIHFYNVPGYVYAYAFGQLLAMSVYQRYKEAGPGFVPRYLELLSAGGSRPPEQLAALVGCDLGDPGFWDAGLDLVDAALAQAEEAAAALGYA